MLETIASALIARGDEITWIYTLFDDKQRLAPTLDRLPRRKSWLNRVRGGEGVGSARRWLLPLYPLGVRALSSQLARDAGATPIDLVISTSSAVIKGLRPPRLGIGITHTNGRVPHLCYCHAPARYLWSQTDEYAHGSGGLARRLGLMAFGGYLRWWDRKTARNVSSFIANSRHIQGQIRSAFARDSCVIHPPVRTEFFTPDASIRRDGSWLYAGALEPYKRVDLIIAAAKRAGARLTIVGDGTQRFGLERLAGEHISFAGRVRDRALRDHYRRASVLIQAQVEDFGIIAVEAQACGLPVVARRAGGALDSVIEHVTGEFFDSPTPRAIADAASRVGLRQNWSTPCRTHAERFAERRFVEQMLAEIDRCARPSGLIDADV